MHRRGTDSRQGTLLLAAGVKLRAPEVAIAASAGMARVRVSSQPMLAVISTGNELVEPGEPVLAHQIRRSNAYAVVSALREHGFQRVADDHIHDDADELRERLKFHLDTHDVLVLSGGVSMGKLRPRAQSARGARRAHGVPQGGAAARQAPVVRHVAPRAPPSSRLPGNPVSTLVCLTRYVLPALLGSLGHECRADRAHRPGRAR